MAIDPKIETINTSAGTPGDTSETPGSSRWWDRPLPKKTTDDDDVEQVHGDLVPYVQSLMTAWKEHEWFDRCHDRIYENRALLSNRGAIRALAAVGLPPSRLMVTTSIVDTFHSRFERRRPMPTPIVDNGDFELQQRAAEFKELIQGKMQEHNFDVVRSADIKDAEIRGNGIAYIDAGRDDIIVERVHRWELFVDPHEAAASASGTNDAVRQMHRVRRMSREVLKAMYPDSAKAIDDAPEARPREYEGGAKDWACPTAAWSSPGMIDVYLSWHLPSQPWDEDDDDEDDCDDGRRAICIEGATLVFDRWKRPRFPFAILRRHARQDAFWGQGDVERLAEDQADINRVARDIQQNVDFDGRLKVFTPAGMSDVPTAKLTGRAPFRVEVPMGQTPPAYVPPNPVSASHIGYLEKRIAWMHDFAGVSQWSAQGRSPLGAGAAAVAIDAMEDLQSDRHAAFEGALSRWVCECAELIIDACREVAQNMRDSGEAKKLEAVWQEHGTIRRMVWDTHALEEGTYRIAIEPVSWLPASVPGKLARVSEISKLGLWSPEEIMELTEMPDLATATNDVLARRKNAMRVMDILRDLKQAAPVPEPEWGLELHRETALRRYNLVLTQGAPEEVAARYRDYANLCQTEIDKAKPPAPPVDPAALAALAPGGGGPPSPMPPMPMDPGMGPGMPPAGMPMGPEGGPPPMSPLPIAA